MKEFVTRQMRVRAVQFTGENLQELEEVFGLVLEKKPGNYWGRWGFQILGKGNYFIDKNDWVFRNEFNEINVCNTNEFRKRFDPVRDGKEN
jgi:hypothetical protein